ncbi:MAG: hypothetical protein JRG94_27100 [Deltaproteobacteria bacterium]|nr:hypothetical protein [Deltaproteobacteria bacterium]
MNTQPGRGTPRDWEDMGGGYDSDGELSPGALPTAEEFGSRSGSLYNWDEVHESGEHTTFKPRGERAKWAMNWDEDQGSGDFPNAYFYYMPRICNHCSKPACLEACPNTALYKRDDLGVVLRDESLCRGAQQCAQACPYKKIYFNEARGTSQHCIGCFPRLEKGVAPACVRQWVPANTASDASRGSRKAWPRPVFGSVPDARSSWVIATMRIRPSTSWSTSGRLHFRTMTSSTRSRTSFTFHRCRHFA